MSQRVWGETENGKIEIVPLTKDKLDGALEVMQNAFFVDEAVSIAVELHKHPKARKELEGLSLNAAKDGVSLVAVEKATGKVVGVSLNKLQVKDNEQLNYFEKYMATYCKEDSSKALIQFMIDSDEACDLFNFTKVSCLMEIMFLSTLREYRKQGIASKLCMGSVNLAEALSKGQNVKTSINGNEELPLEPVPKAVSAIFTSFISQKMGKTLGFTKVGDISYEKFTFNGQTFASHIGPSTPSTTIECKLLV